MKKKILFLLPILALALSGCSENEEEATENGGESSTGETSTSTFVVAKSYHYSFGHLTGTATTTAMTEDEVLAAFTNGYTGEDTSIVTGVSDLSRLFDGNGYDSGAFPNSSGFIKTGSSSAPGYATLNLAAPVYKAEVLCHDWYALSEAYPTNSNTLQVGDAEAQLAPYTEDATAAVLTFEFTSTSSLTITGTNRVILFEITLYTA